MKMVIHVCILYAFALLLLMCNESSATVYFYEEFNNMDAWVQSQSRSDYGKVALSAGKLFIDKDKEQGLQLTEDNKHYALSAKLPTPVANKKKSLVISISVKNEQDMTCGDNFIMLMHDVDQNKFNADSPYWLKFGPFKCGNEDKMLITFDYKDRKVEWNKPPILSFNKVTNVYTVELRPDNTYSFYFNGKEINKGSIEEEWNFLEPRTIVDVTDKKPDDWCEEGWMDDPYDKMPYNYDNETMFVRETTVQKPSYWDDQINGQWKPPRVPNPNYHFPWKPRRIRDPKCKGKWKPRMINNPKFVYDKNMIVTPAPLQYVGIAAYMKEGGTIFDNIVIADNIGEVKSIIAKTYDTMSTQEWHAYVAKVKAENLRIKKMKMNKTK